MNSSVVAALIAGSVSFCGAVVTLITARWQSQLKAKEIESLTTRLEAELESLRQAHLNEITKKRIETYPMLWKVLLTYNFEWKLAGAQYDVSWAAEHLKALNAVNLNAGLFFSQTVYEHFNRYRAELIQINSDFCAGREVQQSNIDALEAIITGDAQRPGLASCLKDDLGSYRHTLLPVATVQVIYTWCAERLNATLM